MLPAASRRGEGGGDGFSGASDRPRLSPKRGGGGAAMNTSPQRARLEPRESQEYNGKLPGIACLPESQPIVSQLSKEQKLPILTCDHKYLDNKVLGKPFGSHPLESSWKNAVIKTKKMKQAEYTFAYGLKETRENTAMPSLAQGSESYLAISNPSTVVQKTKGAANSFPVSSCINEDYSGLPPLYLLPPAPSQHLDGFYKNRGDIAIDNIVSRERNSWKPDSLKEPVVDGGAGEVGAVRLKKYNRCSSLISFAERSKFKPGYHFTDPVRGAPPQYLQRLSQLAVLECETIHQEKTRKVRKTKKHHKT